MQFEVLKLFHVDIYFEKLPFLLFSHTPKILLLTDTVQIRVKVIQEQVASEHSEIQQYLKKNDSRCWHMKKNKHTIKSKSHQIITHMNKHVP